MRVLFQFVSAFCLFSGVFASEGKRMPWFGVKLGEVAQGLHLPDHLPEGAGLLVTEVTPACPVEKAGGKVGDLWWKLDHQMLINKGQLLVLLKMHQPGDEVTLQYYRKGKLKSQKITLGERPEGLLAKRRRRAVPDLSREGRAEVEESAEMSSGEYLYQLQECKRGLRFKVIKGEEVLYHGPVISPSVQQGIKPEWQGALVVLRQALASREVKRGDATQSKLRLRYVPRDPQKGH